VEEGTGSFMVVSVGYWVSAPVNISSESLGSHS